MLKEIRSVTHVDAPAGRQTGTREQDLLSDSLTADFHKPACPGMMLDTFFG